LLQSSGRQFSEGFMASTEQVVATDTYSAVRGFADRPYLPELALFALAFMLFVMNLGFGFVYDDRAWVDDPGSHGLSELSSCFTQNTSAIHGSDFYRPISCSIVKINVTTLGQNAFAFHLFSLFLHGLTTVLVFKLAKVILRDRYLALVAGALFAVHPIHLEPVSWISAFADPLMTLLLLLSAVMWLRWAEQASSNLWWIGAFAVGCAAVLSKEPALMLPLILMCSAFAIPAEKRRSLSALAIGVLPLVAVDVVYLIARHRVLKVVLAHGGGSGGTSTAEMFFSLPSVVWFYMRQLAVPMGISISYPIGPHRDWRSVEFLVALALSVVVCGCAAVLIQRSNRRVQLWVAAAWVVLPLAPMLYLKAFVKFEFVHDRYLYAPSIGFCIIGAVVLSKIAGTLHPNSDAAKVAVPAVVIGLAILVTLLNQPVFRSDITLFTRAVAVSPDNPAAVMDLGTALLEAKDYQRGIPLMERAIELDPREARAFFNRARAAWELGDNAAAERYMLRALGLQLRPEYLIQFVSIEMRLRKLDNAEASAREAIRIDPQVANGHLALGAVLLEKGDRHAAEIEFRRQLEVDPQNKGAALALQQLQQR
jgi:tetratricopeptide (TPR) repeat protein